MSIASIILIAICIYLVIRYSNRLNEGRWILFQITLFVCFFVNCGYAFILGPITITYNLLCQILFIGVTFLSAFTGNESFKLRVRKKVFFADLFLSMSIIIGYFVLINNKSLPKIIPWTTRMDDVFYQLEKTMFPEFGYGNILNILMIIIFALFLKCAKDFLVDAKRMQELMANIYKAFKFIIILALFEFIVNNILSPSLLRNIVQIITGVASNGYSAPQMRSGFYGILLFFNESSYFVEFIALYILLLCNGIDKRFDLKWVFLSIVVLILSGATSAIVVVPVAVIAVIKDSLKNASKRKVINRLFILLAIIFCLLIVLLIATEQIDDILHNTILKLNIYLSGGYNSNAVSGSIRQMGNWYAYNAFYKSPFFGIGLGTLRAYGILPAILADLGIIGTIALVYWLGVHCNLSIKKEKILCAIIYILYFTSILLVTYLYDPSVIILLIAFSNYNVSNEMEKVAF